MPCLFDTIFVDMDGVITDFTGAVCELFGVREIDGHDPRVYENEWGNGLPFLLSLALNREVLWDEIWGAVDRRGSAFWADMPWTPWGEQLVRELISTGAQVHLLTTPARHPSCSKGKLIWIQKNLPKKLHREYTFTPRKHRLAQWGTILVDDKPANVASFISSGGAGFLWPAPYNTQLEPVQWGAERATQSISELMETLSREPRY